MKVFVTGASGFIGGTIAAHRVRAGHEVRGLVRRPGQFAPHVGRGVQWIRDEMPLMPFGQT